VNIAQHPDGGGRREGAKGNKIFRDCPHHRHTIKEMVTRRGEAIVGIASLISREVLPGKQEISHEGHEGTRINAVETRQRLSLSASCSFVSFVAKNELGFGRSPAERFGGLRSIAQRGCSGPQW
jgi:hypothetical protein